MGKELELQKACQNFDTLAVKKLLQKHCTPSVQRKDRTGRLGGFGSKKSINVNFPDESGRTCLHFAATVGDVAMLEDLLICLADPTLKEGRGQTPLHYATMHNKTPGIVDMLVKYGAPINRRDIHQNNPLHLAAMFGNVVAAREMVKYNIDISAINSKGYTPMDVACLYGHHKVAALLLQTHSDVIMTSGSVAARHDVTSTTPLHLAARQGHSEACLVLLKHGFNVNRESTSGTALHEAVLHGRLEVTQLLCEHGADVTIKNVHGQTTLDVAQKLSAAHSADKLAAIIQSFQSQESLVGQAMEDFAAEHITDLDVKHGELVHILSKNQDGRWRAFVTRGQTQKVGHIPWYKLELLSAHCKPATYMRASSQVLSERDTPQFGSLHSLASEYPSIPGNERPHSVAVNGVSVAEHTARLLHNPEAILSYEDAQAQLYQWLQELGLAQHLSSFLDAGYNSPRLLYNISQVELQHVGIVDTDQRHLLIKAANCQHEEIYKLRATPDSLDDWLDALGLAAYSTLFSQSGYEYLQDVVKMTAKSLVKVGVTKPGHRTKFMAALAGLQEWTSHHPLPPKSVTFCPSKPARSMSKTSNFSSASYSPPVSAQLEYQEEPICSSYWETYPKESSDISRLLDNMSSSDNVSPSDNISEPSQVSFPYRTSEPSQFTSESHIPCEADDSSEHIICEADSVTEVYELPPVLPQEEVKTLNTADEARNPFDSDSDDEQLALELTATIKPKRKNKASTDGLTTLQRERIFTLERKRSLKEETITSLEEDDMVLSAGLLSPISSAKTPSPDAPPSPPLSPGEACWDTADIHASTALNSSYAASNTSSDTNIRVQKRGSSEHLDPISPLPKEGVERESFQDLIAEQSPFFSEEKLHFFQIPTSPSPKNTFETDVKPVISLEKDIEVRILHETAHEIDNWTVAPVKKDNENTYLIQNSEEPCTSSSLAEETNKDNNKKHPNPEKPLRRAATVGDVPWKDGKIDDICDSCKLKEDPDLRDRKEAFLQRLEARMSNSEAMKNVDWDSMSPAVAAVVKSVYCDDTDDIEPAKLQKKIPPPVAPKPKNYVLKRASTVPVMEVSRIPDVPSNSVSGEDSAFDEPSNNSASNGIVSVSEVTTSIDVVEENKPMSASQDKQPTPKVSTSVFDDLEDMFDEFSKEMDSIMT